MDTNTARFAELFEALSEESQLSVYDFILYLANKEKREKAQNGKESSHGGQQNRTH